MKKNLEINIKCEGAATMQLNNINDLHGALKTLTPDNFYKLN